MWRGHRPSAGGAGRANGGSLDSRCAGCAIRLWSGRQVAPIHPLRSHRTRTPTVDSAGENCIAVVPGANAALTSAEVEAGVRGAAGCGVLLVQNEVASAASLAALSAARAAGITTVVNAAPASAAYAAGAFPLADVACVNESEAELITGVAITEAASATRACRAIAAMGARAVVVTAGAAGAFVASSGGQEGEEATLVPAPGATAPAVDAVGAGDCFCGVLAARLAAGDALRQATSVAVAAASLSVQRAGAQASFPSAREVGAGRVVGRDAE